MNEMLWRTRYAYRECESVFLDREPVAGKISGIILSRVGKRRDARFIPWLDWNWNVRLALCCCRDPAQARYLDIQDRNSIAGFEPAEDYT